eukprot:g5904.t1
MLISGFIKAKKNFAKKSILGIVVQKVTLVLFRGLVTYTVFVHIGTSYFDDDTGKTHDEQKLSLLHRMPASKAPAATAKVAPPAAPAAAVVAPIAQAPPVAASGGSGGPRLPPGYSECKSCGGWARASGCPWCDAASPGMTRLCWIELAVVVGVWATWLWDHCAKGLGMLGVNVEGEANCFQLTPSRSILL